MKKIKLGIIGIGNMGKFHAKNALEGKIEHAELCAVCDISPEALKWCDENLKGIKQFTSASEMIKSGLIDSVVIAVPHYDHAPLAIEAFENGLNVYCEKPAGVYTKQVLEMNEAAKKSGKVFSMGFNQRTRNVHNKIRELVQNGTLGHIKKVIWIITTWYRPQAYHDSSAWRSTWKYEGGGTIVNQNPHNIDLFQWMFGMPDKVFCTIDYGKYYDIEVDDDVNAIFRYNNGTIGIYTTSTGEMPGTNRLEISADMGKLVFEDGKLTFYRNVESEREFNKNNTSSFARLENWKCEIPVEKDTVQEHCMLIDNFAQSVLYGKDLIAPGVDGIDELTLANSMYYSDWLGGKWIETKNFDHDGFYNALQEKIKNSTYVKKTHKTTATDMGSSFNK